MQDCNSRAGTADIIYYYYLCTNAVTEPISANFRTVRRFDLKNHGNLYKQIASRVQLQVTMVQLKNKP